MVLCLTGYDIIIGDTYNLFNLISKYGGFLLAVCFIGALSKILLIFDGATINEIFSPNENSLKVA